MRRRTAVVGVAAVLILAGGTFVWRWGNDRAAAAPPATRDDDRKYATVEERDLARDETLDGTVGHGDQRALPYSGNGTITGLPEVGTVVANGQQLMEIDGHPVVLLQGTRPAWRSMQAGMTAGEDIRQLETALYALGFLDPDDATVDDAWSSGTTAAVKAMQEALGMPKDGRLDLGEIVFADGSQRVAKVGGDLGLPAGSAGIELSAVDQVVSASLDAGDAGLLDVGDSVELELLTGDRVPATVSAIGAPVVGQDGSATLPVTLTATGLDALDGTPVEIHVAVVDAANATAVPAAALLALAEGGFGLEVADETSATGTRLIPVDVGVFADGWVQVTGDVEVGDSVVTA